MIICAICLNEIKKDGKNCNIKFNCNHENDFHADCLNNWLKKKNSCPICRKNITNIEKPIKLIDIYKVKYGLHIPSNQKYRYIN